MSPGRLAIAVLAVAAGHALADEAEPRTVELLQINRLVVDARTPRDCEWAYRRAHAAGYWRQGREPQLEHADIYLRCMEWLQVRQEQRRGGVQSGR